MKIIAVNGSPRKNWNTAMLLSSVLDGAASKGAQTELYHLYDYNYKGCISCFSCKLKDGISYGHCALKDEITPILKSIEEADALIIGSPIYFGNISGELKSFLERLFFQYLVYEKDYPTLFKRKIPVGFIYTMNVNEEVLDTSGYKQYLSRIEQFAQRTFGYAQSLYITDTYQFDDYSKYVVKSFSGEDKAKRRIEHFPDDLKSAYEIGVKFAEFSF